MLLAADRMRVSTHAGRNGFDGIGCDDRRRVEGI